MNKQSFVKGNEAKPIPKQTPPEKLYKYVKFNERTLRIFSGEVFYANPAAFNDPLDSDPILENDIDREALEGLCQKMLAANDGSEREKVRLKHLEYMSTEDGDSEPYHVRLLTGEVKRLLVAKMASCGVLSLSERWDHPLMWSHYADEHRGLCIEFDMTGHKCRDIRPVDYDGWTNIKTSQVAQMLNGSDEAKSQIIDDYFCTKSVHWNYEQEWRDICPSNGVQAAPFRVSAVYFGLRCCYEVRASVVKWLKGSIGEPKAFYEVYRDEGSSRLVCREVDIDEIVGNGVGSSPLMDFDEIPVGE
jgi:hypothetical protein